MRNLLDRSYIFGVMSVIGHLLLILAVVLSFQFSRTVPILGNPQEKIVNSFLYHDTPARQVVMQKSHAVVEKTSLHAMQLTKKLVTAVKKVMAVSNSKGVQSDELLSLLHAAIQREQRYPASAMQMERQGRVTVGFMLTPSGAVSGLRVVKSSGTSSLDDAALAAVNNAAPFQHLDGYIHSAKEFSIDVVFEM